MKDSSLVEGEAAASDAIDAALAPPDLSGPILRHSKVKLNILGN